MKGKIDVAMARQTRQNETREELRAPWKLLKHSHDAAGLPEGRSKINSRNCPPFGQGKQFLCADWRNAFSWLM